MQQENEDTAITSLAPLVVGSSMLVWVSALLCAADCGALSMCVRELQIIRNNLVGGGWSTTQSDLPCCTVALTDYFVHSPKTPAMQFFR